MINPVSILFYVNRTKIDFEGKAIIYLRVTINSKRAEISTRVKVNLNKWDNITSRAIGRSEESRIINKKLDEISSEISYLSEKLLSKNKSTSAKEILNNYTGKSNSTKYVLEIFKEHNKQLETLIGKEYSLGTVKKYTTAFKHLQQFILSEHQVKDIDIQQINHNFISNYEYFLKAKCNCSHNTTIKYISNFKKIIRIAIANEWITKDPFFNWKNKLKTVEREYLNENELEKLLNTTFKTSRIEKVKDIFLFSCFTGLSYSDVAKLTSKDINIGIDGGKWIMIKRTKTDTRSNIPILPITQEILNKYSSHPCELNQFKLLPVLSNQKLNSYLKEIADLSGINKNLTFHLARHTFATTVTLTNGVPIESVSKMLGHKSLRTTQHYAKILDKKVSEDMSILKTKYSSNNEASIKQHIIK